MTSRRRLLLWLLIPLFGLLFVGLIGSVELLIWLGLTVAWLVAFFTWGKHDAPSAA